MFLHIFLCVCMYVRVYACMCVYMFLYVLFVCVFVLIQYVVYPFSSIPDVICANC